MQPVQNMTIYRWKNMYGAFKMVTKLDAYEVPVFY